jgi:dihydroneopterin aldolase
VNERRIRIAGIQAQGRHGANPGERDIAQPFVVDLDVTVEVDGDSLDETADYGALVEATRTVVETESFELIETLAKAIATVVSNHARVIRAAALVHKPAAAQALGVDDIAVEAVVGR